MAVEYLPTGHGVQDCPATKGKYLPASQSVHVLAPKNLEYFPIPQSVQLSAPRDDEALPASQNVHACAPIDDEYVLIPHTVQGPALILPKTIVESTDTERIIVLVPEALPTGHFVHDSARASDQDPISQSRHTDKPVDDAYFPATQLMQLLKSNAAGASDAVPIGHGVHEFESPAMNLPGSQAVHAPAPSSE